MRGRTAAGAEFPVEPPEGLTWHLDTSYGGSLGYLALYPEGTVFDGLMPRKPGKVKKKDSPFVFSLAGDYIDRARSMRRISRRVVRKYWAKRSHEAKAARAAAIVAGS